jgi:hypothetical protein
VVIENPPSAVVPIDGGYIFKKVTGRLKKRVSQLFQSGLMYRNDWLIKRNSVFHSFSEDACQPDDSRMISISVVDAFTNQIS